MRQFVQSDIKLYLDYDKPPHRTSKFIQAESDRHNSECQLLDFGKFDLVFGHFPIDRYNRETYKYVTLLRDPLERAISHYNYWKNLPKTNYLAVHRNPIIPKIQRGEINFIQFVQQEKLDYFYSGFLNGKQPDKFLLVGFLDNYANFTDRLSDILCFDIKAEIRIRQGEERIMLPNLEEARRLLQHDYLIYEKFHNYWA